MLTNLLLFAGVSLVVIVTPGPDTALTVRNGLFGRRSGILTAVGVGTGQLAWALLTACGVASVLAAHQGALTVLRLAGAAYLVGLGAHALWASGHGAVRDGRSRRAGQQPGQPEDGRLLPQPPPPVRRSDPSLAALAALGLLFAVMT